MKILIFQSKSFLQQQVRSMVGSLKYLGVENGILQDFKKHFYQKRERCALLQLQRMVLYLTKIKY